MGSLLGRHLDVGSPQRATVRVQGMWNIADRVVKAVSDVTFGTVIVLWHVALADRSRRAPVRPRPAVVTLSH